MKQRISVEQLQELTAEQRQRLREWWKSEVLDIVYDRQLGTKALVCTEYAIDCLPLLNIGQMLALLQDKHKPDEPFYYEYHEEEWYVNNGRIYRDMNLVDVLWTAVKDALGEG